jgi:hypothetical protein
MNEKKLSSYEAAKRGLYVPEEWRLEEEEKEKLRERFAAAFAPKKATQPTVNIRRRFGKKPV